jgi:hypothetical protein
LALPSSLLFEHPAASIPATAHVATSAIQRFKTDFSPRTMLR